ncbi:PIN domain-containing protein, partial [Parasediminibacterium sp. JCM 36343]|uniref:PIN domain-containing protein n=1 Tax=Parasediminibacterium sp. JCM 36343 TaxID=3374279 RepID=UPI003979124D
DVIIDLISPGNIRHIATKIAILDLVTKQQVFISGIAAMELLVGATNKAMLKKLKQNLTAFHIIYTETSIAKLAVDLLQEYNLSHGLQIQDSFIAATSLLSSLPLFTYNTKDFKFIKGIQLYQP